MLLNEEFTNSKLANQYKSFLKSRLNEKRYYHSLCVADEEIGRASCRERVFMMV